VGKKIFIGLSILLIGTLGVGCNKSEGANANTNANANDVAASPRPAPDNSEVMTTVDANGVKTETRTFRNNPRVAKVVVTTQNDQRTVRAYSPSGEEKEINDGGDALEATGDKIADAAGWVGDKGQQQPIKPKKAPKRLGRKRRMLAKKP